MSLSPASIFERLAPDCMKLRIEIIDGAWYLDGELYLTTAQAAARTGMSRASIRKLLTLKRETIKAVKLTERMWLIGATSLAEYDLSKEKRGYPRGKPRRIKGQKNRKTRNRDT